MSQPFALSRPTHDGVPSRGAEGAPRLNTEGAP